MELDMGEVTWGLYPLQSGGPKFSDCKVLLASALPLFLLVPHLALTLGPSGPTPLGVVCVDMKWCMGFFCFFFVWVYVCVCNTFLINFNFS